MHKFHIFVCENFSAEVQVILDNGDYNDVVLHPYLTMCDFKGRTDEVAALLRESLAEGDAGLVLCSKTCDVLKLLPKDAPIETTPTNYCCGHLLNDALIARIISDGGYLVKLGWLNKWREHIKIQGFNRETAADFYKSSCRKLVYLDTGTDEKAEEKLKEVSEFLDIPYEIQSIETDFLRAQVESAVYKWRLREKDKECNLRLLETQSQSAEYAAILDLIGKISTYKNKRETVERIKEIFVLTFGTQQFKYWDADIDSDQLPGEVQELFSNPAKAYYYEKEQSKFCIKIRFGQKTYGVIDVADFMFPQYTEKYLSLALAIAKICGLVFSNVEQYEEVLRTEHELEYLGSHDSLTGLYNRAHISGVVSKRVGSERFIVFMFDIDRLKYVNDNFGHAEGDRLIINVAEILKKCFRDTDTVARIGGDEFIAILPNCDKMMAEIIGSRIDQEIETFNKNNREEHRQISISKGFSGAEQAEDTIETLMKKADKLMYLDKAARRKKSGQ